MFSFRVQGSLLRVSFRRLRSSGSGGVRGEITEFTPASRKRLLDTFATIDLARCGRPIFVTLTYGQCWPDNETAKRHLDTLLKRFRRRFPLCSCIWKLEFQSRGAPHFHLIFFNLPFYSKVSLARAWAAVIGHAFCDLSGDSPRPPFTRIERLQSARKAFVYLCKYMAKKADDGEGVADGGGVGSTISHISPLWVGRWWGVFNRKCVPFAAPLYFYFNCKPCWFRDLVRNALPSLFRLFHSISRGWVRLYDYDLAAGGLPWGCTIYGRDFDLYEVCYNIWFYLNGFGSSPSWCIKPEFRFMESILIQFAGDCA